jgi:drug/metabolite transporter (DMT)-like permease
MPYLLASVAIILWGATPAATRIAVEGIDALTVGLVRTVTAALIVFPLALLLRLPTPTDRRCWIDRDRAGGGSSYRTHPICSAGC